MILTKEELIEVLTEDKVNLSTYNIASRTYIRLFNSREDEAHIPALYPNLKEYKDKLSKYTNVTKRRIDQLKGTRSGNVKIDLEIITEANEQLPALPKSAEEL